jgi:hypothetical protein
MGAREAALRPFHLEEIGATASESTLSQAQELLIEYERFVVAQPGAARFCFGSLEQEAARLPRSFLEQGGGCLMANANDEPTGFIARLAQLLHRAPLTIPLAFPHGAC